MSKNVEFHSYSVNVKTALKDKAIAFLHEIGGEIRSQAQRNSRRKTSQTAGSYQYKVDEDALAVHIGSDYWNAIYEEFGTGEHAINGGGRKGYTEHSQQQKERFSLLLKDILGVFDNDN